jgi:hypothetical protein
MTSISSEKFLRKFFEKITDKDFASDRVLAAFYIGYKKYIETCLEEEKKTGVSIPVTPLFQYYTEYLIRNKTLNETQKKEEIQLLYNNIKESIFNLNAIEKEDVNPRFGRKQEEAQSVDEVVKSPTNEVKQEVKTLVKPIVKQPIKKIVKPLGKVAVKTNVPAVVKTNVPAVVKTNVNTSISTPVQSADQTSLSTPQITQVDNLAKIKLNKKHALNVLSEFIKQSFIITYDDPDIDVTQEDEDFRDNTTNVITQEIIRDMGCLPPAQKDIEFNRRNDMIELWRKCEAKIIKFIENEMFAKLLKKIYFLDSKDINTSSSVKTIFNKTIETTLPQETIMSRYIPVAHATKLCVVQNDALSETISRTKQGVKSVIVLDEMQFIPGGDSDQGRESRITPIYYSSSYSMCLSDISAMYPLENTQLFYAPCVLVFKNHKLPNYPVLGATEGKNIAAIASAPRYRPDTDLNDLDKYKMDERLYLASTRYKHPEKFIEQLTGIFNTALFFGFDTIILDDRGVEDNWSPVVHTAILMGHVINQFKGKFKEIVVAIQEPHLFNTFRKYIN